MSSSICTWALWLCGDELPTVMGSLKDVESESDKYQAHWLDKTIRQLNEQEEQEYRTSGVPYIS